MNGVCWGGCHQEIKANDTKMEDIENDNKNLKVIGRFAVGIKKSKKIKIIYYLNKNYKKLCNKRTTQSALVCLHHISEAELSILSLSTMRA